MVKLFVFGDIHNDEDTLFSAIERARDSDLVIFTGDITNFGKFLKEELSLLAKIDKKVLIIPGNNETNDELEEAVKQFKNIINIHNRIIKIGNLNIIGFGGALKMPVKTPFEFTEDEFEENLEKLFKQLKNHNKTILVLHEPPYGTNLDYIKFQDIHIGSKAVREIIERYQPKIVFTAHVHECERNICFIGKTMCMNPGKWGVEIEILL